VKTAFLLRSRGCSGASGAGQARFRSMAQALALGVVTLMGGSLWMRTSVMAQTAAKSPGSETVPVGNTEPGKKLYVSYGCYECHGRAAHGGTGPRLGPDALPFSIFLQYVRHPGGTMPPYTAKVASDQDLADIYAFLKSLPEPPKAKDLPLLKP